MDLISVIVPVYKVEKYLHKCVDSILAQTYTNLEIILVDDGSPDNCGKICDEYAAKDSRIKVIHQQNGGLSAARNAGLDIATGNYLAFIDSDDYIDNNYIECMAKRLCDGNLVSCVLIDENEKGEIIGKKEPSDGCFSPTEALSEMCYERILGTSACGKLIANDIAQNNRFPEGKLYEDMFTVYKWFAYSEKAITVSATSYHYVHRFGSISNNKWNYKTTDLMEAAGLMLDYISCNYPECYKDAVYRYFFSAHDFLTKAEKSKDYIKIFLPYRKKLKSLWKDIDKSTLSLKDYVKFKMMIMSPVLHKTIYELYYRKR